MLRFFDEITKIPRPSGNEGKIAEYLCYFARSHGLEYRKDEARNVIIKAPASSGREGEPAVILQAHTDMVCEKDPDIEINFKTEPIDYEIKDGMMRACGTTLGADDGIGVAMMLAILDDENISHPALECIFTAEEETSMSGAIALDVGDLKGRLMINLDSEEEGYIIVGCAGGLNVKLHIKTEANDSVIPNENNGAIRLCVKGLSGGHSGTDIHRNRANSNVVLGRILKEVTSSFKTKLVRISGGNKENAIPRNSEAVILVGENSEPVKSRIQKCFEEIKKEYENTDPEMEIELISLSEAVSPVLSEGDTAKFAELLTALPNGVIEMNPDIPGFVRTSLNIGVIKQNEDEIYLSFFIRSSSKERSDMIGELLYSIGDTFCVSCTTDGQYPGWEPKKGSPLVERAKSLYKEMYGADPVVMTIHAGLEGGILSEKLGEADVISIGPDITNAHSPGEALDVESAKRVYEYLKKLIS